MDDAEKSHQTGFSTGLAYFAQGRLDKAVACLTDVIAADSHHIHAHHALGLALAKSGQVEAAVDRLQIAVTLAPTDTDIRSALVQFLSQLERWPQVLTELSRLPPTADTLADQALALNALYRFDEAEAIARSVLNTTPDHEQALNNLGLALDGQERLVEAEAVFRRCRQSEQTLNNLGHVLKKLGRIDESIACYSFADTPQIRFNLAHSLLLGGQLRQGLAEYEWRLHYDSPAFPLRQFDQPRWHGQDLTGKTLLIHAEQGFGDSLQFCRFVPQIARHHHVILEVPRTLTELLSCLDGVQTIVPRGTPLPHFDYHCPLVSLAHELSIELADLDGTPYLKPDLERQSYWRQRLEPHSRRRIGMVWAGNSDHANDRNRSVAVETLAPLWEIPGITWFGLQVGAKGNGPSLNLAPEIHSFADTAAILTNLDTVISVDTAVAHLAGALGIPCWLMLPFSPDWRWLLGRDDSPWYNSMRLFRQQQPKDWDGVVRRIAAALTD